MRRLASLLARLLIGLAATVLLLGALLFLLGLHLSLRLARSRTQAKAQLALELAMTAAALASLVREGRDGARAPGARPRRSPPNTHAPGPEVLADSDGPASDAD